MKVELEDDDDNDDDDDFLRAGAIVWGSYHGKPPTQREQVPFLHTAYVLPLLSEMHNRQSW